MKDISVVGLDLAKQVFQVHGVDTTGRTVLRRTLKRRQVLPFFAQLSPCRIGIEACDGMHYWSRQLGALGHEVRAMAPVSVRPYRQGDKTDRNDAAAICEAVQRPHMRFVTPRTPEQQAVLQLHRTRQLYMKQRVALGNHLRGVLQEFGVVLPRGTAAYGQVREILEDGENGLPMVIRESVWQLHAEYDQMQHRIAEVERLLRTWHQENAFSQRLVGVPGIGWLTATLLSAVVGDGSAFRHGRQLAAYLGLVPRQHSSGGRVQLLGITKRGDGYLRSLLVHGARAVLSWVRRRQQAGQPGAQPWLEQLLAQGHINRAAVALANKTARIVWAMAVTGSMYRPATAT